MSELAWAQVFADAARELAKVQGTEATLRRIAELATSVASCPWAAIAQATTDRPVVAATNDPSIASQIAELQAAAGGGPTWDAVRTATTIYVPDLTGETRWPAHVRHLLEQTPVRSVLAFCLKLDDRPLGALTLYSDHPDAFPPEIHDATAVYAAHAAIALDHARSCSQADNLKIALESSREIGTALGILVERYKITPDQAFDMLRAASQHSHRKLRDIAAGLVFAGELDPSG